MPFAQVHHGLRPFADSRPWLVMCDPSFQGLGEELKVTASPGDFEVSDVQWKRFPDGTPNIQFDARAIEGRDVILIGSCLNEHLLPFFSLAYAVPRCLARSLTCIVPFFPTGTMERVEKEGEVATAKTLARMMSATPSPQVGDATFVIFEMHALATRFYFSDSVKVQLVTAIPLLTRWMKTTYPNQSDVVVAFPDEGAKKRFRRFFGEYDICICMKTRVGDRRELVLQEGFPEGKDIVIVDDLVQSGSTLIECKDLMFKRGAKSVAAFVTHAVFPRETWRRFLVENTPPGKKPFTHVVVTDSVPHSAAAVRGKQPFQVLSLSDRIIEMFSPNQSFRQASKL